MKKMDSKQIGKIAENYNLGKVKKFKLIEDGWVNYNYDLETDTGNFIVRVLGKELDDWKKGKLKFEFKVLAHLREKNFPYEVPNPIRNNKGQYISQINKKVLWIYKKIKGNHVERINQKNFKEIVKVLAIYHKFVKDFKSRNKNFFYWDWLFKEYSKMKKIRPKNKTDRLMLENIDFFESLLKKISKINFRENVLATHSDFQCENLLFKGDKALAILDFDNAEMAPRAKDLAVMTKRIFFKKTFDRKKLNETIREYEKTNKLTKREKEIIIPLIIRDNCMLFWWFYARMKKHLEERHNSIKKVVKITKELVKE